MYRSEDTSNGALELFITPFCNQKCDYCYLQKNQKELYPSSIADTKLILKNLKILLDYYTEKKYNIPRIDLFSGEIWGYPLGNEIFNIFLEYLDKGLKIDTIFIPSNVSFCKSKELMKIVENYILLLGKRNCNLIFSISFDGVLLDQLSRPSLDTKHLNKESNEEYFHNLFVFAKRHSFGFHPMISPYLIEQQIQNYDSWIQYLKKYWPDELFQETFGIVMQLETRQEGWTEEKIIHYLKWLKYLIDTDIKEYFNNNIQEFNNQILEYNYEGPSRFWQTYLPYRPNKAGPFLGCSLGSMLIVRLGDLAIVPCHRLSYKQFVLGNYKVENEKIVGFTSKNLPLTNAIFVSGFINKPFCNACPLRGNCTRYCAGANYEKNGEIFYPEESNCELQRAKVIFLIHYFKKLGIGDSLFLLQTKQNFLDEEPEVYNKWSSIIQQLI